MTHPVVYNFRAKHNATKTYCVLYCNYVSGLEIKPPLGKFKNIQRVITELLQCFENRVLSSVLSHLVHYITQENIILKNFPSVLTCNVSFAQGKTDDLCWLLSLRFKFFAELIPRKFIQKANTKTARASTSRHL